MKKRILAVAMGLLIAGSASAYENVSKYGPYLGGDLGWGTINTSNFSNVFAGRIFGGYNFNDYLAAEMGYTKFANSTYNTSVSGYSSKSTIKTYAVDLVAKATLPLQNGFSLFGKLGAAYLNEQYSENSSFGSYTQGKVLPTFGLGGSYDFNKNLAGDISWMHIQKVGNSNSNLSNTDFVGAGLTYSFG